MNTFGDRLRQARAARKLTQDELAERVDVTKSAVSAWENNRESPSFDKLPRLRGALETSLDDLICGDTVASSLAAQYLAIADGSASYEATTSENVSRVELRLLRRYRAAPEKKQRAILVLLD